jgi:hypothetical protein
VKKKSYNCFASQKKCFSSTNKREQQYVGNKRFIISNTYVQSVFQPMPLNTPLNTTRMFHMRRARYTRWKKEESPSRAKNIISGKCADASTIHASHILSRVPLKYRFSRTSFFKFSQSSLWCVVSGFPQDVPSFRFPRPAR